MFDRAPTYLATLPNFLLYFVASVVLTTLFLLIYTRVTPYREWALIRAGNNAAAISLSGAALGFILPLASTITNSVSWFDMVVWGVVAMIIQLATYLLARVLKPELDAAITEGRTAPAISLAAMSIGIGTLNAACLTW
jgi:putative membrane protein